MNRLLMTNKIIERVIADTIHDETNEQINALLKAETTLNNTIELNSLFAKIRDETNELMENLDNDDILTLYKKAKE